MDPQFEELARVLETRLADSLESRLAATLESRLNERFDEFETRVEHRLQVHYERTFDLVKRAAEGYAATLESIDRRLDRLEQKVDHGLHDHAHLLKNHEQRITELERPR